MSGLDANRGSVWHPAIKVNDFGLDVRALVKARLDDPIVYSELLWKPVPIDHESRECLDLLVAEIQKEVGFNVTRGWVVRELLRASGLME